jgi:hydroxymethylpyrimidine pyrophosphatase-like HAD family hydrolase/CBS domain-containing protein
MDSKSFARAYVTATGDGTGLEDGSVFPSLETSYGENTVIEDPIEYFEEKGLELDRQVSGEDYENILVTLDYNGVNGKVSESGLTNFEAAEEAVDYLQDLGVDVAINTGWGARTAEKIADSLDVDHWIAESGAIMSIDGEKDFLYDTEGEIEDAYAEACQEKFEAFREVDSGMAIQPNESRVVDATYYSSESGEDMGGISQHFHSQDNEYSFSDLVSEVESFEGFDVVDGEIVFENTVENASVMNDFLKQYQPMEYVNVESRGENIAVTEFEPSEGKSASDSDRRSIADQIDEVMTAENEHHGDWCMDTMIETPQELTKTTGAIEMAEKMYGNLEDTLVVDFDDKHVFDTKDLEEDVKGLYMTIEDAPGVERAEENGTNYTAFTNIVDGVIALGGQISRWKR